MIVKVPHGSRTIYCSLIDGTISQGDRPPPQGIAHQARPPTPHQKQVCGLSKATVANPEMSPFPRSPQKAAGARPRCLWGLDTMRLGNEPSPAHPVGADQLEDTFSLAHFLSCTFPPTPSPYDAPSRNPLHLTCPSQCRAHSSKLRLIHATGWPNTKPSELRTGSREQEWPYSLLPA